VLDVKKVAETSREDDLVLALGTFDGLHCGHQALLHDAVADAGQRGLDSALVTFEPDPVNVLGDVPVTKRRLLTRNDKINIIDGMGFDYFYEIEFDSHFAKRSAEDFVRNVLIETLSARSVHVGFNFRFGDDRAGDTELLEEILGCHEALLSVKNPITVEGETVSSTQIRKFIQSGDVRKARRLLGRPYVIYESLQPGQGRGQQIGFPTFNFPLRRTIHPRRGVYAVWLEADSLYRGIANFGRHPTVGEADQPLVEVHCLDDTPSLDYGDEIHVYFGEFLRPEKEFDSVDELAEQIDRDIDEAKQVHQRLNEPEPVTTIDTNRFDTKTTEV
jgi:riboflavin kinase/FMN adenylyltransferase